MREERSELAQRVAEAKAAYEGKQEQLRALRDQLALAEQQAAACEKQALEAGAALEKYDLEHPNGGKITHKTDAWLLDTMYQIKREVGTVDLHLLMMSIYSGYSIRLATIQRCCTRLASSDNPGGPRLRLVSGEAVKGKGDTRVWALYGDPPRKKIMPVVQMALKEN